MGFYQIGAGVLPWGVSCYVDSCDKTIEPTVKVHSPDDLFPVMLAAGWGFCAHAGANLPSCPEHTLLRDRANLKRIVERKTE